jgi:hypothetical protein
LFLKLTDSPTQLISFSPGFFTSLYLPTLIESWIEPTLLVGLLFAVLSFLLFIIAFFRSRHSSHDFADRHKEDDFLEGAIQTIGQSNTRIFGRPFVTAGWSVLQVTAVVGAAEIVLFVLVMRGNYNPNK